MCFYRWFSEKGWDEFRWICEEVQEELFSRRIQNEEGDFRETPRSIGRYEWVCSKLRNQQIRWCYRQRTQQIDWIKTKEDKKEDKKKKSSNPRIKLSSDYPSSLKWKDHGVIISVKDQGSCGSCWAFGAVVNAESVLIING